MPFDKVETQVDFPAGERAVLKFWEEQGIFDALRDKNRNGPRWSFLDGPITANNPMGVHHAWGRTYKDAYQRYHAMLGQRLRYQNGFDCQGLWVEVEVEKDLKLQSKRDIENLVPGDVFASIDYFVQKCKDRVDKYARVQTEQSIRLGYWMDWDRTDEDWAKAPGQRKSYFTMSEENNYTIWGFLKKCHSRGLIYRGYDAMPWCPRCAVGLSQMEVNEGYALVAHRAVFVKFPLRGRKGENLLVWTTTPWTLSSNVGAAVNPELTYLKVLHKDEIYYVARGAFTAKRLEEQFRRKEWVDGVPKLSPVEQHFKSKGGFEIVGDVKGAEMVGWTYDGPFDELPAQQHVAGYPDLIARVVRAQKWAPDVSAKDAHRVIAWQDVGETEGTGIVHIAPGCGHEDFGLGKELGLPPVAPLDENGVFLPGFGELTGRSAVDPATTDFILDTLQKKGVLLAIEKYPHSYPHCWRCKTELLFRLVDEWFINMSWRDEIKEVVNRITWLPESINGKARENDWLTTMKDWMISKKRFWGLALPIWVDEDMHEFEVIGSREELKERAVEGWNEFEGHTPHRPWIDGVKIKSKTTGKLLSRIPDVGNPWLDAGIVPYSTMGYNTDRSEWEKWFPADFITESFPGQFRNWFYAMLAMSTMMERREPFKTVLGHALVRDQRGEEMHKTAGNAIEFNGAANNGYELFKDLKPNEPATQALTGKTSLPQDYTSHREQLVRLRGGVEVKRVFAHYDAIGADVIRWMYCRQAPETNINFGPEPADELRSRFVLKVWNAYAFFCNLAIPDEFNPNAPEVSVTRRSDMDRWILSQLHSLIRTARTAFDQYSVMNFCLAAETFVDDDLSNWYVRRSKDRFHKEQRDDDKQAAYQTLYTVLVTMSKLMAPVMPFLAEQIYQNLVVKGAAKEPASVHLCDFPTVTASLIDEQLSAEMKSLRQLVKLGLAARNESKIKVRQPLAELTVVPGSESDRRAAQRFEDLIRDELNVKRVTVRGSSEGLLTSEVRPNLKTLKPKLKDRFNAVQAVISAMPVEELAALVSGGQPFDLPTESGPVTLEPGDFVMEFHAPPGWCGVANEGTQVAINTEITDELAGEGLAREVVRFVNEHRKKVGLQVEDRISLYLATQWEPLQRAIATHWEYIAGETLTRRCATEPIDGEANRTSVKVEGQELVIGLERC
jgi:isoleucyl-tRNA synthetase